MAVCGISAADGLRVEIGMASGNRRTGFAELGATRERSIPSHTRRASAGGLCRGIVPTVGLPRFQRRGANASRERAAIRFDVLRFSWVSFPLTLALSRERGKR